MHMFMYFTDYDVSNSFLYEMHYDREIRRIFLYH